MEGFFILNCDMIKTNDGFMPHFSVDDVIDCFEDLAVHSYDSIFEQWFLNDMKYIHEHYAISVSLYCYYHNGKFGLDAFPDTYREEFEKNADWLKLGVHAFDHDMAMRSDDWRDFYIGYVRVHRELCRIAGDRSIDEFVRFDCYKMPQAALEHIVCYDSNLKGLLCSDTGGNSYALSEQECAIVNTVGWLWKDYLLYRKTDIRLERDGADAAREQKAAVVFTHEWAWGRAERRMGHWDHCF